MGGGAFDGDSEFSVPSNEVRTLVLVGKTGNGKSSTGNSIIGGRVFKSKSSCAGVTSTCELKSTGLEAGEITLNVIDTPGLFDFSAKPELVGKEIVKCIDMAKDGIHALLVVLSVRSRFSIEEEACIGSLRKIFGGKINDYMIVVFTGGDALERDGQTLNDYLGDSDCPVPLKEILKMCDYRFILFDNCTADEIKRSLQLEKLLSLVDNVVEKNGGKPFTNELFAEKESEGAPLAEQLKSHEEQLKIITDKVVGKLMESMEELKQQLEDERAARLQAEATDQASRQESKDEINGLRGELERNRCLTEQLRHKAESIHCAIM